ncbi:MAG: hypothetical protein IBJ03_16990 [Gemmatimonadaceae bacterium]|nr:hypothetical protein [Gemmatimonadaceae bacterium]
METTVAAHAKINLVLRILAREASGYHGIETLFQRLALHDIVRVRVADSARELHCHGPTMPSGGLGPVEQNLAWRAALAFCEAARWDTGFAIDVTKHIPVGGGLGGGSADAAAVLQALNALCPAPLASGALVELGGTLGADVAFLASGAARAWGWGRGDRLLSLPALPAMGVTLVAFTEGVNTGAAYGAFARARESAQGNTAVPAHAFSVDILQSWHGISHAVVNDFESVVPAMHAGVRVVLPEVRRCAAALQAEGHVAAGFMSGSGATCCVLHPLDVAPTLHLPTDAQTVRTSTL